MSQFFSYGVPADFDPQPPCVRAPKRLAGAVTIQTRTVSQFSRPSVIRPNGTPSTGLAAAPLWPISNLPWGAQVAGAHWPANPTDTHQASVQAQAVLAEDTAHLSTAQATLAAAQGALATARLGVGPATAAHQSALAAVDAALVGVLKAEINLRTASNGGVLATILAAVDRLSAAREAVTAAQAAEGEANETYVAALLALNLAQQATDAALLSVSNVTIALERASLDAAIAQSNETAAAAVDPYDLSDQYNATFNAFVLSSAVVASFDGSSGGYDVNSDGFRTTTHYGRDYLSGEYRLQVAIPDNIYQGVKGLGRSLRVDWCEVKIQQPIKTFTFHQVVPFPPPQKTPPDYSYLGLDPDGEDAYSRLVKTTTLAVDDAVDAADGTGRWLLYTDVHAVGVPAGNDGDRITIRVTGPAVLPSVVVTAQAQSATRMRQGWREWTTAASAPTARRYLTLTASATPAAPVGADYTASQYYELSPYYNPGFPSPTPLAIQDHATQVTRSAFAVHAPNAPERVDAGCTILSPTELVCAKPAGLKLTLSDEQTPGSIQDDVLTRVNAPWPEDNPGGGPAAPAMAMRRFSADGDLAVATRCRYALTHQSNDLGRKPATSHAFTSRWVVRVRNLDTGAVIDTPHEKTITLTGSQGSQSDDWVALDVPASNQSITILPLTGDNPDPRNFGDPVATLLPAASGGD